MATVRKAFELAFDERFQESKLFSLSFLSEKVCGATRTYIRKGSKVSPGMMARLQEFFRDRYEEFSDCEEWDAVPVDHLYNPDA